MKITTSGKVLRGEKVISLNDKQEKEGKPKMEIRMIMGVGLK